MNILQNPTRNYPPHTKIQRITKVDRNKKTKRRSITKLTAHHKVDRNKRRSITKLTAQITKSRRGKKRSITTLDSASQSRFDLCIYHFGKVHF
jgi:hypothetical protein